jgi:hypothetical protein
MKKEYKIIRKTRIYKVFITVNEYHIRFGTRKEKIKALIEAGALEAYRINGQINIAIQERHKIKLDKKKS